MKSKQTILECPSCGSHIVHVTPPNRKEKLIAYFVPTVVYRCQPCGCRFPLYDNPLAFQKSRRLLIPLALTGVFLVCLVFFLLFGTTNSRGHDGAVEPGPQRQKANLKKTPQPGHIPWKNEEIRKLPLDEDAAAKSAETGETPQPGEDTPASSAETGETTQPGEETQPAVSPAPETPQTQPPAPVTTPAPVFQVKEIKLGDSRMFRVNWSFNGTGLEITRLSPGPLERAGLRIGDVLVSLNGKSLENDEELIRLRDEIFAGSGKEARIEVLRGSETFVYKLIK